MITTIFWIAVIFWLILVFLFFGPKETIDKSLSFEDIKLGDDLDAYLKRVEAQFTDIKEGQQKQIIWAGKKGAKTEYAVVYMHGFSASLQEIRPVPDEVAKSLGANLFFQRMKGHGRPGEAMANVYSNDWLLDFAEAMAIGRRLGKKVIVMACSNGCAITTCGLTFPNMVKDLEALVFVAPAYELCNKLSILGRLSYARHWAKYVAGKKIGFTPMNEGHAQYWSYEYPPSAIVPMMRLFANNDGIDFSAFTTPVLMMYSPDDKIVSADRIVKTAGFWGANASLAKLDLTEMDDPERHVIMGDITSPNQTKPAIKAILEWLEKQGIKG